MPKMKFGYRWDIAKIIIGVKPMLLCNGHNHGFPSQYILCNSVYFFTNETAASGTKPVEEAYTGYLDPNQPRDFVLIF